jgi:hypothetical protein
MRNTLFRELFWENAFPNAPFTSPLVVIPGVVHEGDTAVDGLVNEPDRLIVRDVGLTDMGTAEANSGYLFAGASECAE